jgi:hypothetical protein
MVRTVSQSWSGEYRPLINFGGRARYCPFAFTVSPAPDCDWVEVAAGVGANEEVRRWLPSLAAGIQRYCRERQAAGVILTGVRIEVHAVRTHPVDTYEQGVERLGFSFMFEVEAATVEGGPIGEASRPNNSATPDRGG